MSNQFRVNGIVSVALTRPAGRERDSFVAQACAGDAALLVAVRELLAESDNVEQSLPEESPKPVLPGEQPGDRIENYKLLQQIGEGGMGTVWMAEQLEPIRRRVALKIVKLGMDTKQVIGRFEAERQALALMDHPNIAKVLDAGATETGRPFFVMELVKGVPITRYCDEQAVSIPERLKLFIEVCRAIQHAHQKGVIHRDIKPSNILVGLHDGVPVPKVIDFGIAKATTDQPLTDKTVFTAIGQFIGTRAYMSPEQAELNNLDVDTRTDIYGLGVLLYELLTGKTPFEEKELVEKGLDYMRRLIREQEPARPSTRISTLDADEQTVVARNRRAEPPKLIGLVRGDLDWIVMKALEKDRTRRYETANGLAMDLERSLRDEPIVARPPSQAHRIRKMFRRNRVAFAVGLTVFAVVLLGALLSTWQAIRATKAENEQRTLREAAVQGQRVQEQLRVVAESNATEAASQRLKTEQAAQAARERLSQNYFLEAGRWMSKGGIQEALAYLAASIRTGTNQAPRKMLVNVLGYGDWRLPEFVLPHPSTVTGAILTPDDTRIITAAEDGKVRIWRASRGELLGQTTPNSTNLWVTHRLNISPDGARIATSSFQSVHLWDAFTGDRLTPTLNHNAFAQELQFTSDSLRLVTVSGFRGKETTIATWDATTGKLIRQFSLPSIGHHEGLLISPGGSLVLTHSRTNAVLWNAHTEQIQAQFSNTAAFSTKPWLNRWTLEFSPDEKSLLAVSRSNVRIWRTNGDLATSFNCDAHVNSAAFSPDGQRVVTTSNDGDVRVWDSMTGVELGKSRRVGSRLSHAEFGRPQGTIITVSKIPLDTAQSFSLSRRGWQSSMLSTFDHESGRELSPPFEILTGVGMLSGLRSPILLSNERILDWSNPSNVVVWGDLTGPRKPTRLIPAVPGEDAASTDESSLAEAPIARHGIGSSWNGAVLAAITSTAKASVWSFNGEKCAVQSLPHGESLRSVHVSDDGQRVITVSSNAAGYKKWNPKTGELLFSGSIPVPNLISFNSDLSAFVVSAYTNSALIFDADSVAPIGNLEKVGVRLIDHPEFCSRTNLILTTALFPDARAILWKFSPERNPPTELVREYNLPQADASYSWNVVPSPCGNHLAFHAYGNSTRVFTVNLEKGSQQGDTIRLQHPARRIQFSPDESLLVVLEGNNAFRVWDVASGQPLTRYFHHDKPVMSCTFSGGSSRIAVLLSDGSVQTWDLWPQSPNSPDWLPSLAEAVGGLFLDEMGVLQAQPDRAWNFLRLREMLQHESKRDEWSSWGKWFLTADNRRHTNGAAELLDTEPGFYEGDSKLQDKAQSRRASRFTLESHK